MTNSHIITSYESVLQENIEDWTEKVHTSIPPDSSLVVEYFMSHEVSHTGQLAVTRVSVSVEV